MPYTAESNWGLGRGRNRGNKHAVALVGPGQLGQRVTRDILAIRAAPPHDVHKAFNNAVDAGDEVLVRFLRIQHAFVGVHMRRMRPAARMLPVEDNAHTCAGLLASTRSLMRFDAREESSAMSLCSMPASTTSSRRSSSRPAPTTAPCEACMPGPVCAVCGARVCHTHCTRRGCGTSPRAGTREGRRKEPATSAAPRSCGVVSSAPVLWNLFSLPLNLRSYSR